MKYLATLFALCTLMLAPPAQAQTRAPIILSVPYPAGGILDVLARVLSQKLHDQTKEVYIVENRPGANGMIGAKAAAKARPDGRTWIIGDGALMTVNPFLYPADASFNPEKDLRLVRSLGLQTTLLVVNPNFPAKTLQDFVEIAKKQEVNYASGGIGSSAHLAMAYFGTLAGLKLNHIAYKGGPPAIQDLVGGQVQAGFIATPNVMPFVKRNQLRALAVSGNARTALLPEVPTVVETGFPGFVVENTYFLMLPSDTPADVVKKVDEQVLEAMADPAVQERIRSTGLEPYTRLGEAESRRWMLSERGTWQKVIQDNKIRPE